MISTAYKLCAQIIESDYPSAEWNIYPFHFSDGDNWSADDTRVYGTFTQSHYAPVQRFLLWTGGKPIRFRAVY